MSAGRFKVRLRQLEGQAAALQPRRKWSSTSKAFPERTSKKYERSARPELFEELLEKRFAEQPTSDDGYLQVKCVRVADVLAELRRSEA